MKDTKKEQTENHMRQLPVILLGIIAVIILIFLTSVFLRKWRFSQSKDDIRPGRSLPADTETEARRHAGRKSYSEETTGTTAKKKHIATEATTEAEEDKDLLTEEVWYRGLEDMGRKILGHNLDYQGNASHKTFEGAIDFNCALYVSWTLQELELLPSGKTFWFGDKGHGSGFKYIKKHPERFMVYYPNCPMREYALLKPGDICGMLINGYAPHTAVYAGKNKKGHRIWYSAGRTDFRKMAKNGFKPVRFRYYEQQNDMLYTVVRIKFDRDSKKRKGI